MHAQLEILLQIQDLRSQRERLSAEDADESTLQREHFGVDVSKAVATLDEKIHEMEEELEPAIRSRYDRIAKARSRVVAPVIDGTCYACFVSIPTAHGVASEQNRTIRHCENCGRFIYRVG